MYQINLSIGKENSNWYQSIQDVLEIKLKKHNAIVAAKLNDYRLNISLACENENKAQLLQTAKECFCDMYGGIVKEAYLKELLNLPNLKPDSYDILLHTLVAFDRETEKEIISGKLSISDSMALDGVFNFVLTDLKERWNEIATLAIDNATFLMNDETLNELLRFLVSAINPKILKLEIKQNDNDYNIIGEYADHVYEYNVGSSEQLLKYLIDVAPLELRLRGSFSDKNLYNKLVSIFDAKHADNKNITSQR